MGHPFLEKNYLACVHNCISLAGGLQKARRGPAPSHRVGPCAGFHRSPGTADELLSHIKWTLYKFVTRRYIKIIIKITMADAS